METTQDEASQQKQKEPQERVNVGGAERKASMVGGAALALSGIRSMTRKNYLPGLAMMAAGGLFLYRGKTGHCDVYQAMGVDTVSPGEKGIGLEKVVTINRPRQQVYDFWHNLENLPRFMQYLESVQVTGDNSSHWRAKTPGGLTVEWDAETTVDEPGSRISWHTVGETSLPSEGTVEFSDAPAGRGTEVRLVLHYFPPGGAAGKAAAKLLRHINAQLLEEELKRLKQLLETGEVATADRTYH